MEQNVALVQERIAAMQIQSDHGASGVVSLLPAPAPLTLSLQKNSTRALVGEEPDSPTSPSACTSPGGYSPLIIRTTFSGEYGTPPSPVNQGACYSTGSYASRAMDAFQSVEDKEPFSFDDLEYGDMYPESYSIEPHTIKVPQSTAFAETALQCHNDNPSNEVKYELIKATKSSYMFEGSGNYGHVNFTARAKQEGSEEELFFAELCFGGDFTTLTCFCSLKEDQVGGLMGMDSEGKGVDLEHCYGCWDALKHPRDGASYLAGHRTGPRRHMCP